MKAYINKFFMGAAAVLTLGLTGCVGDLDQMPKDVNTLTPDNFASNPKEYIGGALGKCYAGIAMSGSGGSGSSDISGLDNGRSCWSRAIFMLNEFTTDECNWIWKDSGVYDLCTDTWSSGNENVFGTYSRFYCHIAVCNDFMRLIRNAGDYGVNLDSDPELKAEYPKFLLEARALRDLTYFYILDIFGNAADCWDDQPAGQTPQYITRQDLFAKVTADLEDILATWDSVEGTSAPVYGRVGKDGIEALLAKFYLNAKTWGCGDRYQDCWTHCVNVINRHQGGGFEGSGLAMDYLSLFCGNNDMFAPGGSLPAQNETLWNIPYSFRQKVTDDNGNIVDVDMCQSYGGTNFLILAAISDKNTALPSWYGMNESSQWTCMHARPEFSNKFNWVAGEAADGDKRTTLWLTENDGFSVENTDFSTYKDGYVPIKFTNVKCNADGTMPVWRDPASGLWRAGVHDINNADNYGVEHVATFPDTDYPVIRLAEIYLTAAEAHILGGVGNAADAVKYVNYIRRRAGVSEWTGAQLNENNILDERARELYWENGRRTDLVRHGKFTGHAYNWAWKNNVENGGSIDSHMDVFPIPTQVINAYAPGTYPQNPGY